MSLSIDDTEAVMRVSPWQLLDVWSDLEEARLGVNGFGGNTAEVYVYRLMPFDIGEHGKPWQLEVAAKVMSALLCRMTSVYAVRVFIGATYRHDGEEFGGWFRETRETHRWHIRIRSRK